jgi:hypothetical protein
MRRAGQSGPPSFTDVRFGHGLPPPQIIGHLPIVGNPLQYAYQRLHDAARAAGYVPRAVLSHAETGRPSDAGWGAYDGGAYASRLAATPR